MNKEIKIMHSFLKGSTLVFDYEDAQGNETFARELSPFKIEFNDSDEILITGLCLSKDVRNNYDTKKFFLESMSNVRLVKHLQAYDILEDLKGSA